MTLSPVNPLFDFGGAGPLLHFAHANAYPPAAYQPLIEGLTPHYHVIAMRTRPLIPGADPAALKSWLPLVDDLVAFLDERRPEGGWLAVGHSLGAVTTVLAALQRPELFRAVVAIDPVFFNPLKLAAYDVVRGLGLADRVHPLIAGARRRRRAFASADEMFARYRQAAVFSRLDDRALRAYVDAVAAPRAEGQGVELSFSPEWETQIYATGPFNLWRQLVKLNVPMLVIRGADSDTFDQGAVKALRRRLPQVALVDVPAAGHLVALEKPGEVARLIITFLEEQGVK